MLAESGEVLAAVVAALLSFIDLVVGFADTCP